jgi:hypothetical protein
MHSVAKDRIALKVCAIGASLGVVGGVATTILGIPWCNGGTVIGGFIAGISLGLLSSLFWWHTANDYRDMYEKARSRR